MDFYHVMNRGVDKRHVVMNDDDKRRFVHSLYLFNNVEDVDTNHRRKSWALVPKDRAELVSIHAWVLLNNHYHLLLTEKVEGGISKYMHKVNTGYSKYFNIRQKGRSGALWQGRFKRVHVSNDAHFKYIPYYIHLNALDFTYPEWRMGGVFHLKDAVESLNSYVWSSHRDYLGIRNFPLLLTKSEIEPLLGDPKSYCREISKIISDPDAASAAEQYEYR